MTLPPANETGVGQTILFNNLGPDDVDAAQLEAVAERVADLLHRRLLSILAAGLLRQADHDVLGSAEALHLGLGDTSTIERLTYAAQIGSL